MGALGSYDINVDGELSVAGLWVNNFGASSATYQSTAWTNGGSITLFVASDVLAYFNGTTPVSQSNVNSSAVDISGSIYVNSGSKLDLTGGGSVSPSGKLTLTAKGGNLALESDTAYFQLAEWSGEGNFAYTLPGFRVVDEGSSGNDPTAVNPSQINARIVIDPASIEAQGFGGGGTFTLVTPQFDFGTGTPVTGTLLPMNFFSTAGFGTYDITSYKTAFIANTFVGPNAVAGGYNALLDTQTLTVGAGQTLALTQSVLPSVMTMAQSSALLNLATGGDVLSAVAPTVPGDAWDQKAVNLNLGGLIELHVAQGGSVIGSPGSSLTMASSITRGPSVFPAAPSRSRSCCPPSTKAPWSQRPALTSRSACAACRISSASIPMVRSARPV